MIASVIATEIAVPLLLFAAQLCHETWVGMVTSTRLLLAAVSDVASFTPVQKPLELSYVRPSLSEDLYSHAKCHYFYYWSSCLWDFLQI